MNTECYPCEGKGYHIEYFDKTDKRGQKVTCSCCEGRGKKTIHVVTYDTNVKKNQIDHILTFKDSLARQELNARLAVRRETLKKIRTIKRQ